jgi:hypothetical protein
MDARQETVKRYADAVAKARVEIETLQAGAEETRKARLDRVAAAVVNGAPIPAALGAEKRLAQLQEELPALQARHDEMLRNGYASKFPVSE